MKQLELTFDSYKDTDQFLQDCYPNDMDITVYEGVLVDNFLGYDATYNGKNYKYLIIEERYINAWTSNQHLILTNNQELFEKYRTKFQQYE